MYSAVTLLLTLAGASVAAKTQAPAPSSSCTVLQATPTPTASNCNVGGTLSDPAVINTVFIPITVSDGKAACAVKCTTSKKCLSFAWNPNKRSCTLYSKTLADQGLKNPTKAGTDKSDISCYKKSCCTLKATSTPTAAVNAPTLLSKPFGTQYDDTGFKLKLPFNISLYDQSSDTVYINVNGLVSIGRESATSLTGSTQKIPYKDYFPSTTVMAAWAEQLIKDNTAQEIIYDIEGTQPNRVFNVQWFTQNYYQPFYKYNYIATWHEADPESFVLTYKHLQNYGTQVTVGAQTPDGSDFVQYSRNENILVDDLELVYHPESNSFTDNVACVFP